MRYSGAKGFLVGLVLANVAHAAVTISDAGQVSGLTLTFPPGNVFVCIYFTGYDGSAQPVNHENVGGTAAGSQDGKYDYNPNMEQFVSQGNTNGLYLVNSYTTAPNCVSDTSRIEQFIFYRTASDNQYGTPGHWSTEPFVPEPPRNLVAAPDIGRINLTWDGPTFDGGSPVIFYRVYRGTSAANRAPVTSGECGGMIFTMACSDTGVVAGQLYDYVVRAVSAVGESAPSNSATATATSTTKAPTAHFAWSPPAPKTSGIVQFTNLSTETPTSWTWSFGDGAGSTAQNPAHVFSVAGSFTVTLTASNTAGSDMESQVVTVTQSATAPTADFSWSPISPKVGDEIQFTDGSTGTPTSWNWTFGDGGQSASQNPRHVYEAEGTYPVRLSVANDAGSNAIVKNVNVSNAPVSASFAYTPPFPGTGELVTFTDTSSGPVGSWSWAFGDGATSELQNPTHSYEVAGTYLVTLAVANGSAVDSATAEINVSSPCPVAALAPVAASVASYEASAPLPEPSSLDEKLDATLNGNVARFQEFMKSLGMPLSRTSGYRPSEYQDHFCNIRDTFVALTSLPVAVRTGACADVWQQVNYEINTKHGLVRDSSGVPLVSTQSSHSTMPALAVDLSTKSLPAELYGHGSQLDAYASQFGLTRPCGRDLVHFQLKGSKCGTTAVVAMAMSPVAILLTDPSGRRIGFDPLTQATINEIGLTATYSGTGAEPQVIVVDSPLVGAYRLTGIGTGSGQYILRLMTQEGEAIASEEKVTGTATAGNLTSSITIHSEGEGSVTSKKRSVRH